MSTSLVLYENAKRAVAQLREVDEVAEQLDKAAALEEYARRAKDRELETHAAEYRTWCEWRIGEFSAAAVRPGPGGDVKLHSTERYNESRSGVARRTGVNPQHLLRTSEPLAAIPAEELAERVESIKANGEVPTPRRVLKMDGPLMTSGSDEWYTPEHVWRAALAALRLEEFDLDPCADPGLAIAARKHYTQSDDGLSKPWHGAVWMNPPYSDMATWIFPKANINREAIGAPAAARANCSCA